MIKAIIFDVDGVLLDSFEVNFIFYKDLLSSCGFNPPTKEQYEKIIHMPLRDALDFLIPKSSIKTREEIFKKGLSRDVPYHTELVSIPDQCEEVLVGLKEKYLLGIVTSRVRKSIYEVPQLAKLRKYFKVNISYEDTIRHKPFPDPLLLIASKLSVKPKECVYIGDTESDIKAARAAGMKIILYSRKIYPNADAKTSQFKYLPKIIESLQFPKVIKC